MTVAADQTIRCAGDLRPHLFEAVSGECERCGKRRPTGDEPEVIGEWEPGALLIATRAAPDKAIQQLRWASAHEIERRQRALELTARPDDPADMTAAARHDFAAAEYIALTRARDTWPPPCSGDPRFIDDHADTTTRADLHDICATRCRIRAQCFAYADKARPPAGIWAGWIFTHPADRIHATTQEETHGR